MSDIVSIKIYNLPDSEMQRWVVVRLVSGKLWFYGTYDDRERAEKAAGDFENGLVIEWMN